jgi:hypothetical protein
MNCVLQKKINFLIKLILLQPSSEVRGLVVQNENKLKIKLIKQIIKITLRFSEFTSSNQNSLSCFVHTFFMN